jgi:DNA polymerase-3 subunit alpha
MLKPTEFEHISAVIALYRPGPMGMNSHTNYAQRKNGQQQSEGVHPELTEPLKEILDPTYGLIVYQEQVMAVAQKVAGYTLGQADLLRRAMGKKKPEELEKQFEMFSSGMRANGYSPSAIKALWDTLLPFADYAFNKAHSAGYAVLSYWTAYLKANFPAEYMAALLTSVGDSKDKLGVYLNECRKMGIRVLPPDVNQSIDIFAAVGEDIRFGLAAIRNVGQNVVDAIAKTREPLFSSFDDYLRRAPAIACTKRVVESLIKAGALDSLGHTRRALFAIHEEAIDASAVLKREAAGGQVDLFGDLLEDDSTSVPIPELPEWTKRDLLAHEREMLGLYVSDHPLAGMEAELMRFSDMGTAALRDSELADGETVTIAGLITQVQHRIARSSGNQYAQVSVEDFSGEISVMFMGKTYQEFRDLLVEDAAVSIRGRISRRDEEVVLQGFAIEVIEPGRDRGGVLQLSLTEAMATREKLMQLATILDAHPGPVEVQVKLTASSGVSHFMLPQRVRVGQDLFGELKALLGSDAVS